MMDRHPGPVWEAAKRNCRACGREVWPHSWPGAVLWHDVTGKTTCRLAPLKQHSVLVDEWPDKFPV